MLITEAVRIFLVFYTLHVSSFPLFHYIQTPSKQNYCTLVQHVARVHKLI